MEQNKKISVIIPTYNVESYIEKCVDSVLNQSYKNFEILVVDDGSTDNSGDIADSISKKDDRIKVIHKENGGVSSARNIGIDNADGEYIVFIDADDYIADDFLEYMINMATATGADFCLSKNCYTKKDESQTENESVKVLSPEDATSLLLSPVVIVGCWNKIFKKSLLTENNLKFSEDLFYGEGLRFITMASQLSNCVAVGDRKVYYYRRNNDISATSKFDIEKLYNGENAIKIIENDLKIKSKKIDTMLRLHLSVFCLGALVRVKTNNLKKVYLNDYKRWKSFVRRSSFKLLFKKIPLYRKLLLLGGGFFPSIVAKLDVKRRQKISNNSVE